MNDSNRLAALWLSLLFIGALAIFGIHLETQPPEVSTCEARAASDAVVRNHRYLMQSKADPSKWEALEVMGYDRGAFYRTELTPAQARRWMEQGCFRHVSNQEYNDHLAIAAGYVAARAQGSTNASR